MLQQLSLFPLEAAARRLLRECVVRAARVVPAAVITKNAVADGSGSLAVDCTVSIGGLRSDWSKVFHFMNGEIVSMDYRRR
jgi:hypothetical protein